jgi:hypothetical protein
MAAGILTQTNGCFRTTQGLAQGAKVGTLVFTHYTTRVSSMMASCREV